MLEEQEKPVMAPVEIISKRQEHEGKRLRHLKWRGLGVRWRA